MRRIVHVFVMMISLCIWLEAEHFPLEISFINQAVREPTECIGLNPLYPGISIGTEFFYSQGRLGELFQGIRLGHYTNKYKDNSLFLQTAAGYRYTLGLGLFADAALGLGYLHTFHPKDVNVSKGAVIFSISLGVGYDFSKKIGWPISIFARYEPYIQSPYSMSEPDLLQGMFHFGLRVQIP